MSERIYPKAHAPITHEVYTKALERAERWRVRCEALHAEVARLKDALESLEEHE